MQNLFGNIRFYIIFLSLLLSLLIYIYAAVNYRDITLIIKLTQIYAFISVIFLYFALLASPLIHTFGNLLPFQEEYKKARRALGVAAFYFAFLHFFLAFFIQLGGFEGLFFLSPRYLIAVSFSFAALLILFVLSVTSFDKVIKKMTFSKWKKLQQLVYLAGIFTLIHALLLGTHFADLSSTIPVIFFAALSILLLLEALRVDARIKKRLKKMPTIGISVAGVSILLVFLYFSYIIPKDDSSSGIGIHSEHLKQMEREKNSGIKFVTVNFTHPETVTANTSTPLSFSIYNTEDRQQLTSFSPLHEKLSHLIIIDSSLSYFEHRHPDLTNGSFSDTVTFPQDGTYYLYLDFKPDDGVEQQKKEILNVGTFNLNAPSTHSPDTKLTKTVQDYQVTLQLPASLTSQGLSKGNIPLTFLIEEANGTPVTNLKPYLGSFGHMVMINAETYSYLHIHPATIAKNGETGGPSVSFYPMGPEGPIEPGIYRIFAQFDPNDTLITADFTIEIK